MSCFSRFFTWLLPSRCLLCHARSEKNINLCQRCEEDFPTIKYPCFRCAIPLTRQHNPMNLCGQCLHQKSFFYRTISLFHYEHPADQFISQLKFHEKLENALCLGTLLARTIQQQYQSDHYPSLLLPVPLHQKRLKERGFNQALEITRPLSRILKIPIDTKSVTRTRYTAPQTHLSAKARATNMKNAFDLKQTLTAEHIAIVDDVMTTGQTVTALACALKQTPPKRIDIWCCARACNFQPNMVK